MDEQNKPDNDPAFGSGMDNEIPVDSNSALSGEVENIDLSNQDDLESSLESYLMGDASVEDFDLDSLRVDGGSSETDNFDDSDNADDLDDFIPQDISSEDDNDIDMLGFDPAEVELANQALSEQELITEEVLEDKKSALEESIESSKASENEKPVSEKTVDELTSEEINAMSTEELEARFHERQELLAAEEEQKEVESKKSDDKNADEDNVIDEPISEDEATESTMVEEPVVKDVATEVNEPVSTSALSGIDDIPVFLNGDSPYPKDYVASEPVSENVVPETRVVDEPVAEDVAPEAPVIDEPVAEDVAPEAPVADESVAEDVAPETPIVDEPVAEDVAPESPVIDEPFAEDVAPETPVVDESFAEDVAPETSIVDEPVAEDVAPETPVVDESFAEDVAPKTPVVDEPVAEGSDNSPSSNVTMIEDPIEILLEGMERDDFEAKMSASREKQAQAMREEFGLTEDYVTPPIVQYQKYMLTLQELNKYENLDDFKAFVEHLVEKTGNKDNFDATGESLANIDIEMGQIHLNTLREIAPDVVAKVEANIQGNYDAFGALKEAGFDLGGKEGSMPMGFPEDLQVMMAYDDAFPDENRPSIVERLRDNKDKLMKVFKSDKANIATSTVAFGIACAAGSAVLPLAGALYASKLMSNPIVQDMANSIHKKIGAHLVTMGFKKENIQDRENHLGDKMKSIMDSKWGKVAGVGLAASVCGFGLYSLMDATGFGLKDVKEFASNASDKVVDVTAMIAKGELPDFPEPASVLNSLSNGFSGAMSTIKEAWGTHAAPGLSNLGKYFGFEENSLADVVDKASEAVGIEVTSSYTAEKGDNLWNMAKEHYMEQTSGKLPSPQQIIAMINDLGVDNPNSINPGDKFTFENDVAKYGSVESVKGADWLINANEAIAASKDLGTVINSGMVNVGSMYDISNIAQIVGEQSLDVASLAQIAEANPDIDLDNLMPGDKVNFENGGSYTVPSIEDAIANSVFPSGLPEFVDKERLLEFIQTNNPDIELDEGFFDIPSLFGNSELGKDMANLGVLNIPEVNLSDLNNPVSGEVQIAGAKGSDINRAILKAAYPDGIPELLDRGEFIASVKEANPSLKHVGFNDRFNLNIDIPSLDANNPEATTNNGSLAQGHQVTGEPTEKAKSNFIKKFLRMDNDQGLTV